MTQKKLITESELRNSVSALREYMAIVESQQTEDAQGVGQAVGNALGGVAGAAALPVRGAAAAGNWLSDKVSQGWNAAKQGAQNFAQGVTQGAQQGWQATSPQAIAQAVSGGAAKAPTTPDEIKAFQKANGLTADGVMGPKTLAAMKAKGMSAPAAKPAAAPAAKPAAAPAAAPTTQTFDDGSKITTAANGQVASTDSDGNPYIAGTNATANTNIAPNMGQVNKPAPATAQTPNGEVAPNMGQVNPPAGGYTQSPVKVYAESADTAGYSELQRLVTLVQYR